MFGENVESKTTGDNGEKESYWGVILRSVALICLGVTIKVVADRVIYHIEAKLGNNINDSIWKPKRYGNSNNTTSSYSNSQSSSYGSNGSMFGNRGSNPFL